MHAFPSFIPDQTMNQIERRWPTDEGPHGTQAPMGWSCERLGDGGVLLIGHSRFGDERGVFAETYNASRLAGFGVTEPFVQDNFSRSTVRGVVRGLHFQRPPFAQAKLVRVVRGSVFEVVVDIRKGSPGYGRAVWVTLTGDDALAVYVPVGFAHGFAVLEADTEVAYKVSAAYDRASEGGLRWDDPALAIAWPIGSSEAVLKAGDRAWPLLSDLDSPFVYGSGGGQGEERR